MENQDNDTTNPPKEALLDIRDNIDQSNNNPVNEVFRQSIIKVMKKDIALNQNNIQSSEPDEINEIDQGQQETELLENKIPNHIYFSWRTFFKFALYHTLYYFLTGPLTVFIFPCMINYKLGKNLGFIGVSSSFAYQTLIWMYNVYLYICFIMDVESASVEIYMMFILSLFQILSCSVKYAIFPVQYVKSLNVKILTKQEKVKELMMTEWNSQEKTKVYDEVVAEMAVNLINPELLWMNFSVPLDKETADRFRMISLLFRNEVDSAKTQASLSSYKIQASEKHQALNIIFELIENFKGIYNIRPYTIYCNVVAIVRAIIPLLFFGLPDLDFFQILQAVVMLFVNYKLYLIHNTILSIHIRDLSRKGYFMEQLTYLLVPRKFEGWDNKKVFPTMNLLESQNLKTWNSLRKICLGYGKSFDERVQRSTSFRFMFYIAIFALWYASTIKLFQYNEKHDNTLCLITIVFLEILNIFGLSFIIFVKGAKINDYYAKQNRILIENKILYLDIMRKCDYYFYSKKVKSSNYLYQTMITSLRDTYYQTDKDTNDMVKEIKHHLKGLVSGIEELIEELDLESELNPFTVFGMRNIKQFLVALSAAMLSIFATVVILVYSKRHILFDS